MLIQTLGANTFSDFFKSTVKRLEVRSVEAIALFGDHDGSCEKTTILDS